MTARSGFPRFQGPFKLFSISTNTNRETGLEDRLYVFSQGSRAVVFKFLWLKYLWDELSKDEWLLFLALPETLNSEIIHSTLRAVMIIGKKRVRDKLVNCNLLPKDFPISRLQYLGMRRIDVEIHYGQRSLSRVPKYSGYVRSASAVGSKRSRGPSYLEPLAIIENDYADNCFNWYTFLTVEG